MNYLDTTAESTQAEMMQAIQDEFKKSKVIFKGSVPWHLEWVKLDLEARKKIKRLPGGSPVKYTIA